MHFLSCKSSSSYSSDSASLSPARVLQQGVITACLAPAGMYVLIYGQGIHFAYLFLFIIVSRILLKMDLMSDMKPFAVLKHATLPAPCVTVRNPGSRATTSRHTGHAQSSRSVTLPRPTQANAPSLLAPTAISSGECPITKVRRGILNKISPDKLAELHLKLVQTFDGSNVESDASSFFGLVFAAASRQPQYTSVFAELIARVSSDILERQTAEDILTNQCQIHWAGTCMTAAEKTRGWELLSVDDQVDARARHRSKQLAVAEFVGLLASTELIPASFPLSWIESLMRPISSSAHSHVTAKTSSTEAAIEIICCVIRGLGHSEAQSLFTDMDQERFNVLCSMLFGIPTNSARVRCMIQDLKDLRESGWSKLPTWKQALVPTKRTSSFL